MPLFSKSASPSQSTATEPLFLYFRLSAPPVETLARYEYVWHDTEILRVGVLDAISVPYYWTCRCSTIESVWSSLSSTSCRVTDDLLLIVSPFQHELVTTGGAVFYECVQEVHGLFIHSDALGRVTYISCVSALIVPNQQYLGQTTSNSHHIITHYHRLQFHFPRTI